MCKVSYAAIIFADIPFNADNPHQHYGGHFYVIVANPRACMYSPVVQAIPMSSNCNRRLPVQIRVEADCFSRESYVLTEQLTLLPKDVLERGKYCGQLGEESMSRLRKAIKMQLALD